ncbi:hypothetical protein ABZ357_27865 [Streptomyces sp. NPDC005917]|uniref:hypothetical protein n=1 Tax=unclassified Streptomyces TaxID=2593676 RepID=UPI0033D56EC2
MFPDAPSALGITRLDDEQAAYRSLALAEILCTQGYQADDTPDWIDFFGHARIVTDAVEVFRDLNKPEVALRWNGLAALPANQYTRCHGMRLAIVSTAHLQRGELDEALHAGRRALEVLRPVKSTRVEEHLKTPRTHLTGWHTVPEAQRLLRDLPAAS